MLIERERRDGIRSGAITVLFRRRRRRQVTAGHVYRTSAGRIAVDAVDVVTPDRITDADAVAAGYPSAAGDDLRGRPGDTVFRLRIRFVDEPDSRDELAASAELPEEDVRDIGSGSPGRTGPGRGRRRPWESSPAVPGSAPPTWPPSWAVTPSGSRRTYGS